MSDKEEHWKKLAEMEAETKRVKKITDAQRMFEGLSIFHEHSSSNAKEAKPLPVFPTYKCSKPGLHESVIVGGLPLFVRYDSESGELLAVKTIEENSRVLRPPNLEEYSYRPYEFVDAAELSEYFKRAKNETLDSLYRKALGIVRLFNDQDDYKQSIIAVDLVWSFFQDKFGAEPPHHTRKGNVVVFNLDKLRKIQKSYETDTITFYID
jgi:hypothetical protein